MRRILTSLLTSLMAISLVAQPRSAWSHAQKAALEFADYLLEEKRYSDAFLEYQRVLFAAPDLRTGISVTRMFDAGILAKDYTTVTRLTKSDFLGGHHFACETHFYRARALYGQGDHGAAADLFADIDACTDLEWISRGTYFAGLSNLHLGRWESAANAFQSVPLSSQLKDRAANAASLSLQGKDLPYRSPSIAAVLGSLLPGAGYAYSGFPQTGLAAFFTNAIFMWGTIAAAKEGQVGLAALGGMFSFGWYFGSIYGSAKAASRHNMMHRRHFIERFELN